MYKVLGQSINVPGLVAGRRNANNNNGSAKSRRSVTISMMYATGTVAPRLSGFSGLRTSNSFDSMLRPVQGFHSKVFSQIDTNRARGGRGSRCVTRAMFERFTEKAIKVIMLAQEEARRLGHNFVGTEHILLGLIGEGTGIAAKVLKSMGVNLKDARVEVEKIVGMGSDFVAVEIPLTLRAKTVLERSLEEARQLGDTYIGTEHLLLGLLLEGESVAARVLKNLGADPTNIRTQASIMFQISANSEKNKKMSKAESEAGYSSRVRLHAQLFEKAKGLEKEIRRITKETEEAVCNREFEKAGELWDLSTQISALIEKIKEMSKLLEEARILEKEVKHIIKAKDEAVLNQEFEKAGELRDKEMVLKRLISALIDLIQNWST